MLRIIASAAVVLALWSTEASARHRHHRAHHGHGAGVIDRSSLIERECGGHAITVSLKVADQMCAFIEDVVERGFEGQIHCFSTARSHVTHSLHKWGGACDFAQRGWGRTVKPMYEVGDLASKHGLRDGCTFTDCGHIDAGTSRRRFARRGGNT